MIVALDARKLRDGGIGSYIRGLLGAYAGSRDGDRVVALVDPDDVGWLGARGAVSAQAVRAGKYGLLEHVLVPRAAARAHADVLHAPHYTLPLGWRGPSVVSIHDLTHVRFPHLFPPGAALYARAMAGAAARQASVVLAPSTDARRDVIERLGIPERKVRLVPLGVSSVFAPSPPQALAEFRVRHGLPLRYALYVGAHKPHKNLALLLDAWARIPERERPTLALTGTPWPADHALARRARERGVERSLAFVPGITDDRELASLYTGATVFLLPSLAEGFGLPPLEAMACGTPVVSSDAGPLPEVLGDAARLLSPHDAEGWAQAVREAFAAAPDPARIAHGRAWAAGFTWERTAAATREAYVAAIG